MTQIIKKTGLLASIVLISITLSAQRQGDGQGAAMRKGNFEHKQQYKQHNQGERLAIILDLTDEQKTKFEALRFDHQKKMLPLTNDLGEKQAKMKTLQTADKVDMTAINKLIDEMSVTKAKMEKNKAAMHQDMRKVLTEEQRVKFDMHAKRTGRKGRGGYYYSNN